MEEDKRALKWCLGFLGALAILGALWRVLSYEPNSIAVTKGPAPITEKSSSGESVWDELKEQELLGPSPRMARQPTVPVSASRISSPAAVYPSGGQTKQTPSTLTVAKPSNTAPRASSGTPRYVETNFYSPAKTQTPSAGISANAYQSAAVNPQVNFNTSAMQEERARMLAPYLRPNRQDKQRMDEKWAKLAAGIERAVAQALMPKSKKEALIEKYSAAKGGDSAAQGVESSGFTGPLAPVGQQLATQKQSIMRDFASAFGNSAAQQAGGIMDNFSHELASALQTPGLTQEQASKQVKEISKKYQKQMDQLAEKNQYDKYVAQRTAQITQEKDALRNAYNDDQLNQKFNQIYDQAWLKEQELMAQSRNMTANEYAQQMAQNNYQVHHELEEAVRQAGQSLEGLHKLETAQAQKALEKQQQLEESGQTISVARKYTEAEKTGISTHLAKEQTDMLGALTKVYGEQNKADFEQLLTTYQQRVMQSAEQELSPAEHKKQEMQLANEFNRQLIDLRIEKTQQMNIPEEQKQAIIQELRRQYNTVAQ